MPDFTARVTTPSSTLEFADTFNVPARLNPVAGHPHRYVQVVDSLTSVVAKATVGVVEGELDANLGGRLFQWWWVQWPNYPAMPPGRSLPTITTGAGQSSVATLAAFPSAEASFLGLWLLMCWREGGGGVMLPFNVEA
jgi:hypothetical protein